MGFKDWMDKIKSKIKPSDKEKKPFSIKEIGLPKLIILLICGIVILMPMNSSLFKKSSKTVSNNNRSTTKTSGNEETLTNEEYTGQMENKLKQALSQVKGIGNVEVMITVKSSEESVVLKDEPTEENTTKEKDSTGGTRNNKTSKKDDKTVMSQEDGSSVPYVVKKNEPEVEGVLVIAEGAQQPSIQEEIVDAVMVLFDVPAHKIKVMNMN